MGLGDWVAVWVTCMAGIIGMCILSQVARAWFGVSTRGCGQNWVHFCCEGGWVIIFIIMDVLGGLRMVGLELFFILGGQYGVQRWLVGP